MYEFSISSFIIGVVIVALGVVFVKYHQKIADTLAGGVGSYDKYKLYAFILCGVGFLVMLNLPSFLLDLAFGQLFGRR